MRCELFYCFLICCKSNIIRFRIGCGCSKVEGLEKKYKFLSSVCENIGSGTAVF